MISIKCKYTLTDQYEQKYYLRIIYEYFIQNHVPITLQSEHFSYTLQQNAQT